MVGITADMRPAMAASSSQAVIGGPYGPEAPPATPSGPRSSDRSDVGARPETATIRTSISEKNQEKNLEEKKKARAKAWPLSQLGWTKAEIGEWLGITGQRAGQYLKYFQDIVNFSRSQTTDEWHRLKSAKHVGMEMGTYSLGAGRSGV